MFLRFLKYTHLSDCVAIATWCFSLWGDGWGNYR